MKLRSQQLIKYIAVIFLFSGSACQPNTVCPPKTVCPPCPVCEVCPANNNTSAIQTTPPKSLQKKPAASPEIFDWFVTHVTDGDTLVVKQELPYYSMRKETIRMLNINTPERGEPLYKEATIALKEFVKGGDVTLEYKEPGNETRGVYGRLLAYIFVDGKNINVEMVRLGLSTYWTKYGKSRFDADFKAAEQEAKNKKLGLWN